MPKKHSVLDRLKNLAASPVKPHGTLAMAEGMLDALEGFANGERTSCTINRYCRTRIFDFPQARITESVPHSTVYQSNSVHASLVCDSDTYFGQSHSPHYALSPSLRHDVAEKRKMLESQRNGVYPYLVIEELNEFTPFVLDRGCASADEVRYQDGQRTPFLTGGRDNERFIVVAFETSDGPWPDIPHNEQTVNMILATTRACQDTDREIAKHVDQMCLITDDDQFVCPMSAGFFSARGDVVRDLDANGFEKTAKRLQIAASRMDADMGSEHIELLVNALYWDDYKDDDFRRLHYLSLWQSLSETSKKLGHATRNRQLSKDHMVLAGSFSLAELTRYRDDIAHFWAGSIDGNYLAGIYRTINELIRRKYFQ